MCECGCSLISYQNKVILKDGSAMLFGVYSSCRNCQGPAGLRLVKIPREQWRLYDVEVIPEMKFFDDIATIDILDIEEVRNAIRQGLIGYSPESGTLDEIDADTLAEEIAPDLREMVAATVASSKKRDADPKPTYPVED